MRISDWSSDVCSSDLRESRALHHPDGEPVEEEPRPERIEEIGDRDQPELRQREQLAPRRAAMPPGAVVTDFGDLFGRYSRLIGGAVVIPKPPGDGPGQTDDSERHEYHPPTEYGLERHEQQRENGRAA